MAFCVSDACGRFSSTCSSSFILRFSPFFSFSSSLMDISCSAIRSLAFLSSDAVSDAFAASKLRWPCLDDAEDPFEVSSSRAVSRSFSVVRRSTCARSVLTRSPSALVEAAEAAVAAEDVAVVACAVLLELLQRE